eukprot:6281560-Lingulodinium_polyedra.AAC.1
MTDARNSPKKTRARAGQYHFRRKETSEAGRPCDGILQINVFGPTFRIGASRSLLERNARPLTWSLCWTSLPAGARDPTRVEITARRRLRRRVRGQ